KDKPNGEKAKVFLDAGQNPPDGVLVYYYLKQKPEGEITLAFLDAKGNEIKRFSSEERPANTDSQSTSEAEKKKKDEKKEPHILKEAGTNRFVWNMRYPDPSKVEGYVASEDTLSGPLAPPGKYQVRLMVGDETYTETFEIHKDPRIST